jgi:hypothetical protein
LEWAGQANQSLPSHCPAIREFDLPAHRGGVCVFLDATLNKGLFSGAINDITFTHLLPGIIGLHVVRSVSVANAVVGSGLVLVDIPYIELPPTCRLVSNCAILRSSLVPYLTTPCRRVCRRPKAYDLLCVCSAAFVWFRSFSKISIGIRLQNLFRPQAMSGFRLCLTQSITFGLVSRSRCSEMLLNATYEYTREIIPISNSHK